MLSYMMLRIQERNKRWYLAACGPCSLCYCWKKHELYPTGYQLFAHLSSELAQSSIYEKASSAEKHGNLPRAYS